MKNKDIRHLTLIKSYYTCENGEFFKVLKFKNDKGEIIKEFRDVDKKTFRDMPTKKTFRGVVHSLEMALHHMFENINSQNDLAKLKIKAKQINHFVNKLYEYASKENINSDEVIVLVKDYLKDKFYSAIEENPENVYLPNALNIIIENSILKDYIPTTFEDIESE